MMTLTGKGILACVAIGTILGLAGRSDYEVAQRMAAPASAPVQGEIIKLSPQAQKIAARLASVGSPIAVPLAQEIAKLKRPRLATAVAVVESRGVQNIVGAAGERGIWQILEREHGLVPDDIKGQAQKFEEVMEQYIRLSGGNLREACRRYNSGRHDRSYAYADKVMREVSRL